MTKNRRKFTPEDRLSILKEGEREGRATDNIRIERFRKSLKYNYIYLNY